MNKLSGQEMKAVQPLERKNNAFVMEPNVLEDITSTLERISGNNGGSAISIDIPQGVNCSYKGALMTVSHRVEIAVVSGRFKNDVADFQIPFTVAYTR